MPEGKIVKNHQKILGILFVLLWLMPCVTPFSKISSNPGGNYANAATDTTRVEWKMNQFPNPGFEKWYQDTRPEDISFVITKEHYAFYETNLAFVNEGARSFVLQARALDPADFSEAVLKRSSWSSKSNPVNLTLKFDWFIDELPSATDNNYLRLKVQFYAPGDRNLYYYFESQSSLNTNSTNNCYFQIAGPMQTWNIFSRNMTDDYFEAFGSYPTYQFYTFEIQLRSLTTAYCRAFFDDIWLVNGTTLIGGSISNGNFETGGIWLTSQNNDPSSISKSTVHTEGDFSLNTTVLSNGNESYARFYSTGNIRASSLNPDRLGFQWRIDNVVSASENTYAYLRVHCLNESDDFYLTYALFYIGDSVPYQLYGGQGINATGFNVTGQWHVFDRSIWDDVISMNTTDYIVIDEVDFEVYSRDPGAQITILFDDVSHITAALSDMGYEDQQNVGDEIWTWNLNDNPAPNYTVTDIAHSGSRAANLSLTDGEYFGGNQYFENYQINENTDVWLDLYWRIEDWSMEAGNILYIEVYLNEKSLTYIIANNSAVPTSNEFEEFIMIPDHNIEGSWINLHRNIYNDYETAFGVAPDTTLYGIYLYGEADVGGQVQVLFDDVYLYLDPAPAINNILFTSPIADRDVNVSAQVYDPSLASVVLRYQIDGGIWTEIQMTDTGNGFNATIPGQPQGTEVQFYIKANDTFEQVSQSSQVGYTIPAGQEPPPPDYLPLIVAILAISAIGIVIIVYIFVIRPKQGTG
jgi:hypothetical protein